MKIQRSGNDGLPIVNGRKVRRRGAAQQGASGSSGIGGSTSFVGRHFWKLFMFVALLIFYAIYFDKIERSTMTSNAASLKKSIKERTGGSVASQELTKETVKSTVASKPDPPKPDPPRVEEKTEPPNTEPPNTEPPKKEPVNKTKPMLSDKHPPRCTAEDQERVGKLLSPSSIVTHVTGSPYNPILMREFYASNKFQLNDAKEFVGIVLNWSLNDVIIDMLRIGSRDIAKYNMKSWNQNIRPEPSNPLPPVIIPGNAPKRPAHVVVLQHGQKTTSIQSLKEKFGYADAELDIVANAPLIPTQYLETLNKQMPSIVNDDYPIHYMDLRLAKGQEISILQNVMPLLANTRFLHFQQNKRGDWIGNKKLSGLIGELKKRGLVCYYAGRKENKFPLYRITDCFLEHYNRPNWLAISCVNVNHADVQDLANQMEERFQTILKS